MYHFDSERRTIKMSKKSNSYYLKEAPIRKAIAHLSIPMMIGISATTIYNLINAYFIGLVHDTNMMSTITLGLTITIVFMALVSEVEPLSLAC